MSDRELRALRISNTTGTTKSETPVEDMTVDRTAMATTATQANPYRDVIGLSSTEGKKMYQNQLKVCQMTKNMMVILNISSSLLSM